MKKILLIEDDEDFRASTVDILSLSNYEVQSCKNGKEGVQKSLSWKPDLIICDIILPHLDGYGVLRALRNSDYLKDVLIICISGHQEIEHYRKCMEFGADDFLLKPFSPTELLKAIETRFDRHAIHSEHLTTQSSTGREKYDDILVKVLEGRPVVPGRKGSPMFEAGQTPRFVCYVISGMIRTIRFDYSGKELTTGIYTKGQFVGLSEALTGAPFMDSAIVLLNAELVLLPIVDFLQFASREPVFLSALVNQLASDLLSGNRLLLNLAYQDMRGKVALALIRLHQAYKLEDPQSTFVKQPRTIIASIAGVAKESATRTMIDFVDEGLVEVTPEGYRILNIERLERLAG
jgi:CheY-like chemotaxis protein